MICEDDCDKPAVMGRRYCKGHLALRYPPIPDPDDATLARLAAAHEHHLTAAAARRDAAFRLVQPAPPEPGRPLVVIPCCGQKAPGPQPPAQLYTSSLFRLGARAALALTTADRVLILSARHGFLRYDSPDPIAPYDERIELGNSRRDPAARHRQRALTQRLAWGFPEDLEVVGLLSKAYLSVARAAFPKIVDALGGSRGIGDQRGRLAAIATKGSL